YESTSLLPPLKSNISSTEHRHRFIPKEYLTQRIEVIAGEPTAKENSRIVVLLMTPANLVFLSLVFRKHVFSKKIHE
ncbi:TPA: hypothetical protein ACHKN0_004918, partial [Escherichia coli]